MVDKPPLQCPFCSCTLDGWATRRLSFRADCPSCRRDLHACLACQYYAPGKPNSCLIPGTEAISDRAKNNYCEEFSLREFGKPVPKPSIQDIQRDLFK